MTDETREQIKRDSTEYGYKHFNRLDVSSVMAGFTDGATHQHPIAYEQGKKDGWNEAIEFIRDYIGSKFTSEDFEDMKNKTIK